MFSKIKPSKKNIVFAILMFFLIILIATSLKTKQVIDFNDGLTISALEKKSSYTVDTDSDNLKDWEELLYKTNKSNKDTDNDGTDDYTEIIENRNPNTANTSKNIDQPNDFFPKLNIIQEYTAPTVQNIKNTEEEYEIKNIPIKNYTGNTTLSDLYFVETTEKNIIDYMKFYYVESQQIALFFEKDVDIIKSEEINKIELSKLITLLNLIVKSFRESHLPENSIWAEKYHLEIINTLEKMSSILKDLPYLSNNKIEYYSTLKLYYSLRENLIYTLSIVDDIFNITRNVD